MDSGPLIPANSQILRELQPAYPIELNRPAQAYPVPLGPQDSPLREYLRVLIKRKWLVVSTVAVIFAVVAIATLRSTPIYDAGGSIAVNRIDPVMLNLKDNNNAGSDYYDPTDLDTEVSILKSDLL